MLFVHDRRILALVLLLMLGAFFFVPASLHAATAPSPWQTTPPQNSPVDIDMGGSLLYPGSGDTIYAFKGGFGKTFLAYSISNDNWSDGAVADAPNVVYYGGSLVYPDSGDTIYAFPGQGTETFLAYSISNDNWSDAAVADAPQTTSGGASLVYPGSGDTIYAFRGFDSQKFWAYSISNDNWDDAAVADAPGNVEYGGSLVYPGSGDTIYAFKGNNTNKFWAYSISNDNWDDAAVADAPGNVADGGSLVNPGSGDTIYAFKGNNTNKFWAYSISNDNWSDPAVPDAPANVYTGGSLVGDTRFASGNHEFGIFAFRGGLTNDFWKYNPNRSPVINPAIPDQTKREDAGSWTIPLESKASDADNDDMKWVVADGADTLVTATLTDGDYDATGDDTLDLQTRTNASGTSAITLKLGDGRDTVSQTFRVTLTEFEAGDGSSGNPYHVKDWRDLDAIRDNLASHFILVNDLDKNSFAYDTYAAPSANGAKGWAPIGSTSDPYQKTFNGDHHLISDLVIDRPSTDEVGLFGVIDSPFATVQKIHLRGVDILGQNTTGGLVGKASLGPTISRSSVTGTVEGTGSTVGGIVGFIGAGPSGGGFLKQSHADGTVSGDNKVGGLVGESSSGRIGNSYTTAEVTGTSKIGGVVGRLYKGHFSFPNPSVSRSYAAGNVQGSGSNIGGLVGSQSSASISNSSYDTYATNQSSGPGTGRSTFEMTGSRASTNMSGLDFSSNWDVRTRSGPNHVTYPYLSWQTNEFPKPDTQTLTAVPGHPSHGSIASNPDADTYLAGETVALAADGSGTHAFRKWTVSPDSGSFDDTEANPATYTFVDTYVTVTVNFTPLFAGSIPDWTDQEDTDALTIPLDPYAADTVPADMKWEIADGADTLVSATLDDSSYDATGDDTLTLDPITDAHGSASITMGLGDGRDTATQTVSITLSNVINFTNDTEPMGINSGLDDGSIQWGDYDRDGDLDLAVSGEDNSANGRLIVYENDGSGNFTNVAEPMGSNAGVYTSSIAWGDYDHDGDLDLAVSGDDGSNERLIVFENDGAGNFTNVAEPMGTNSGVDQSSIAWGDYDNDGYLDLAVSGNDGSDPQLIVFEHDGSGTFTNVAEPMSGDGGGVYQSSIAWGDFDGDGELDLAVSGNVGGGNGRLIVFENDDGNFTNVAEPMSGDGGGLRQSSIAWGDYDNDGDLDLAVSGVNDFGSVNNRLVLYRNDGNGNFSKDVEPMGNNAIFQSSIAWGDYDNDGDLDLAVSGNEHDGGGVDPFLVVFGNDGTGNLTNAAEPMGGDTGVRRSSISWGDYDNDGDLDLAVSGDDGSNYRLKLFNSDVSDDTANARPSAPSTVTPDGKRFSNNRPFTLDWSAGGDDHTADDALTYNLRIGSSSGQADVLPADADGTNVPQGDLLGNVQNGDTHLLDSDTVFTQGTYYWAVQAVDQSKQKSDWSSERTFEIVNDAPVMDTPVAGQTEQEDTGSWTIPLTNRASDTNGDDMKWQIVDGADTLVTSSLANNSYSSNGEDTLILVPKADAVGQSAITIEVGDGLDTVTQTFTLELRPEGKGTIANPYEIEGWADLDRVRTYSDSVFQLVNNLNSNSRAYDTYVGDPSSGWLPIDDFSGVLAGENYEIHDLVIDRSGVNGVGLFGGGFQGKVRDLGLVNTDVTGRDRVGPLVGQMEGGIINKTYTQSALLTNNGDDVGGLVGVLNDGTIESSRVKSPTLEGSGTMGGMVGNMGSATTIRNSYVQGDTAIDGGNNDRIGGLIGSASGVGGAITIKNVYAAIPVKGNSYVGGLVGRRTNPVSIENSFYDTFVIDSSQTNNQHGTEAVTVDMARQSTFEAPGWDFSDTWTILEKTSYPYFQWQTSNTPYADTQTLATEVNDGSLGTITSTVEADTYLAGETVSVTADTDVSNSAFVDWSVSPDRGSFSDTSIRSTVYSFFDTDVTVRAKFSPIFDGSVPDITDDEDTDPRELDLEPFAADTIPDPMKWVETGGGTVVDVTLVDSGYTTGGEDTLFITPIPDANGTDTISLSLGNGADTAAQTFAVTLNSVNDTPLISPPVPDQTADEDTGTWNLPLKNHASDTEGDPMKWTADGGGTVVDVSLNGTGYTSDGEDTLTINPISGVIGTDTITLSLGDGADTATQTLTVTITPVGSGTSSDPFLIENWTDLDRTRTYSDSVFKLVNDLNSTSDGYDTYVDGPDSGWLPVDDFSGTIAGNNNEIHGLVIDRENTNFVGLFGNTFRGTITNLGLVEADVTGNNHVAPLVGHMDGGAITSSYTKRATLTDNREGVGGLVGRMNDGTIQNSFTTRATLTGNQERVGGLVGQIDAGILRSSYAQSPTIENNGDYVGGLIGYQSTVDIRNVYSYGDTVVDGGSQDNVGGLVGYTLGLIENAYAAIPVKSTGSNVGGLVGNLNAGSGGSFENSFYDTFVIDSARTDNEHGTGARTVDLVRESNLTGAGWDFGDTWTIDERISYPFFQWQTSNTPLADTQTLATEVNDGSLGTITSQVEADTYLAGGTVSVTADTDVSNSAFVEWSVAPGRGSFSDTSIRSTVYSFVDTGVTVTANFTPIIEGTIPDQTEEEDTGAWTIGLDQYSADTVSSPMKWEIVDGADTLANVSLTKNRYNATGEDTLTLDPLTDALGTDSITLALGDGRDTATQSFQLTLNEVNDAPYIQPTLTDRSDSEDTNSIRIPLVDHANDTDGDPLKWRLTSKTGDDVVNTVFTKGGYNTDGADTLVLDPIPDANGTDTVVLRVGDGQDTSTRDTFTITLAPVNDTPVIAPEVPDVTIRTDSAPARIPLESYASDTDGNLISWGVTDGDTHTTVTTGGFPTSTGADTLTVVANGDTGGTDTVTLKLGDGKDTAFQKLLIRVHSSNSAPRAQLVRVRTLVDSSVSFSLRATDPDGDSLTYSLRNTSALKGSLTGTSPNYTYRGPSQSHQESLVFEVADGSKVDTSTVQFSVYEPQDIQLDEVTVHPKDTPLVAQSGGTVVISAPFRNDGGATAQITPRTNWPTIQNLAGDDVTRFFDITRVDTSSRLVSKGDSTPFRWRITFGDTLPSPAKGALQLRWDTGAMAVYDTVGEDTHLGIPFATTYDEDVAWITLAVRSGIFSSSKAGNGIDTMSETIQSVRVRLGLENDNSTFDTGGNGRAAFDTSNAGLKDQDEVLVYIDQVPLGDTDSVDSGLTRRMNPEYSFSDQSIGTLRSSLKDANNVVTSTGTGEDTTVVPGSMTSVSFWKNSPGVKANYLGDDLNEIVRITIHGVMLGDDTSSVAVAKLQEGTGRWSIVDKDPKLRGNGNRYTVSFEVDPTVGLSMFQVIRPGGFSAEGTADETVVYPNPFRPHDGDPSTGEYGRGTNQGIYFGAGKNTGFPPGTRLEIYTINGEEIDSIHTVSGGLIQWDARTRNGSSVASGVYLYHIDVPNGGTRVGKVTIIR